MVQLPRPSSVKVTNANPRCLYRYFNLGTRFSLRGEGCNAPYYENPNQIH
jgi:hypothetical protein